jgi:hypothetical protein
LFDPVDASKLLAGWPGAKEFGFPLAELPFDKPVAGLPKPDPLVCPLAALESFALFVVAEANPFAESSFANPLGRGVPDEGSNPPDFSCVLGLKDGDVVVAALNGLGPIEVLFADRLFDGGLFIGCEFTGCDPNPPAPFEGGKPCEVGFDIGDGFAPPKPWGVGGAEA